MPPTLMRPMTGSAPKASTPRLVASGREAPSRASKYAVAPSHSALIASDASGIASPSSAGSASSAAYNGVVVPSTGSQGAPGLNTIPSPAARWSA